MKKIIFSVVVLLMVGYSCSKEQSSEAYKKSTENPDDGDPVITPDDFDCNYILASVPAPIFDLLDNPDDAVEEENDKHLYRVAKALSRFTCAASSFSTSFLSVSFDRYGDGMLEIDIIDLATAEPDFYSLLVTEFAAAGLDWDVISTSVAWQGNSYKITGYLENSPIADWNLPPYIGIGTDLDVDDAIGDYIPAFFNEECQPEAYEPTELMICKVDPDIIAALPEPISYSSECLYNPLIIVQLGWEKTKKAIDLGDPSVYSGTVLDTVISGIPKPGAGCDVGDFYFLKQAGMNGVRFERSKHSDFKLETYSIAVPGTSKNAIPNTADSKKEHLRKIHKNDKWVKYWFDHEYVSIINYPYLSIGPVDGVTPDENCYSVTYEYDWYMFHKKVTFWHYNGIQPKLRLNMKGDHDYYQIMNFLPADWCHGEVREFTSPIGRSIVQSRN